MTIPPLPTAPGAYRWLYADASAGEFSAVAIFMVGAVFSARYAAAPGRPLAHCAVNFALYRNGRRLKWVFTEYDGAEVAERSLRIGASRIEYAADGTLEVHLVDRTAPWGGPLEAHLTLRPACAPGPAMQLVADEPHWWQPLAAHSTAQLVVPALGVSASGDGYHDTNWGDEPLGLGVPGWSWSRHRHGDGTEVRLRPFGDPLEWVVLATGGGVVAAREAARPTATRRTPWGLHVPTQSGRLLESSPFYARFEAGGRLGEVADFRRFRKRRFRWMAGFRSRKGAA